MRENETVRELQERVENDLDPYEYDYWQYGSVLQLDGRTLSKDATLRESNVNVQKPLVYARR